MSEPPNPSVVQSLAFDGKPNTLSCVCFSPDGRILAVGSQEGIVKVWNIGESPSGESSSTRPSQPKGALEPIELRRRKHVEEEYESAKAEEAKNPIPKVESQPTPAAADKPRATELVEDATFHSSSAWLADDLVESTAERHDFLLNVYRDGKDAGYTQALALAIPKLSGDLKKKTREVLAERLARMRETQVSAYLVDENVEILTAAARASAIKGSKTMIPKLIPLLRDTRGGVAEAAHQALKNLTGQDFGPEEGASRDERIQATRRWTAWWDKAGQK